MILRHILALFSLSAPISAVSSPATYSSTTITPSFQTPNFTFAELYNLTDRFLKNHMYPLNIAQSLSINSSLLSPDILGRVDATRDYAGRELNTEYLFGLFANIALNPDAFTLLGCGGLYVASYKNDDTARIGLLGYGFRSMMATSATSNGNSTAQSPVYPPI
ncbi:hypothetical protein KCU64_g13998, partial [Aureobasidium melanogenum]